MKLELKHKVVPVLILSVGGVLLLGLTFMGYYGVVLLGERFIAGGNPQLFPMDRARFFTMAVIFIVYILVSRFLKSDLLKSLLFISPFTMALVVVILKYYETPFAALAIVALLYLLTLGVFRLKKRNWMYYYAASMSFVIALAYAWSR